MIHLAIGTVETITGIKSHVLRYWETILPLISPVKDHLGYRKYNARNIDFIFRLKFLTEKKSLTLQQAAAQVMRETMDSTTLRTCLEISLLRSELLELYIALQKKKHETKA